MISRDLNNINLFVDNFNKYFDVKFIKSTTLSELDIMDSLGKLKVLSFIECYYKKEISITDFDENSSISDLYEIVCNNLTIETHYSVQEKLFLLKSKVRPFLQSCILPLLKLIIKIEIIDSDSMLSVDEKYIFVSNHVSHLDTPIIILSLPKKISSKTAFAAAADVFYENKKNNSFKTLFCEFMFNIYPFSRNKYFLSSLRNSHKMLRLGYNICIFPESKRSTDGKITVFKNGVGVLVKETGLRVVPIHINGLFNILKRGKILPTPGKAIVNVGKPISFDINLSCSEITRQIENEVIKLSYDNN